MSSQILFRLCSVAGAFSLPLFALAQDQSAPASPASTEKTVVLSPFTITTARDYGYRATNSITATGIGTEIGNVPVNIAVVTSDFIADKMATDLRQVIGFVSAVQPSQKEENIIAVRGFTATVQQNGFNRQRGFVLEDVERVEVIKGASAVFHGLVQPGGVVNIITKKPSFTTGGYIKAAAGSYNYGRIEAQSTGPLVPGKLAYLVYASAMDTEYWRDYVNKNQKYYKGALTWIPFQNVSLTVEASRLNRYEQAGNFLTTSHEGFLESGEPPTTSLQTWTANKFGPNEPSSTIIVQDKIYPGGYRYNLYGPTNHKIVKADVVHADLTAKVTDWLTVRNATFMEYVYFDELIVNNGFRTRAAGAIYDGVVRQFNPSTLKSNKTEAVMQFDLGPSHHDLILGYQHNNYSQIFSAFNSAPVAYYPFTDSPRDIAREIAAAFPNGFKLPGRSRTKTNFLYVSDQVSLFDGKLRLLGGARQTNNKFKGTPTSAVIANKKGTPQFGALLRLGKGVSAFAGYSKTFESSTSLDGLGVVVPPVEGEGFEAGLKGELFDGKLSGTVSVYRVNHLNIARRDFARENELRVAPIYSIGGYERSEGVDLDLTYSPVPNYQLIFAYTYMPTAETLSNTDDPNQVGRRFDRAPEHKVNVWNKYTFNKGPLKGLHLGGGISWSDEYYVHPSWRVAVKGPSFWNVDAFAGYKTKLLGRDADITLNVNNVFDRRGLTYEYLPTDPLSVFLSTKLSF